VTSRALRLRAGALLTFGALTVHELRYVLAYREQAGAALHAQGHAYLAFVTPLCVALVAVAAAHFLWRVASNAEQPGRLPGRAVTWAAVATCLVGCYVLQESLEGLLASGHPGGLVGIFGHGGWLAVPLAMAVAAVIVLVLGGAADVLSLTRRARVRLARPVSTLIRMHPPVSAPRRQDPCAAFLAPRGPPPHAI
jgi:hypothetical protein